MRPLQLRVTAEPLELRAYPEPPGRRPPAPGCQVRRVTSVAGAPFGSLGCLIISAFASAMSHFILAESQAMNLALTVVLTLTFQTVERRARSARYPCLITAETEPPGRLHSSTGSSHEPGPANGTSVVDAPRFLWGSFQSQGQPRRKPALAALSLTAPGHRKSLSTIFYAVAAQRNARYALNPWKIRANQCPLRVSQCLRCRSLVTGRFVSGPFSGSGLERDFPQLSLISATTNSSSRIPQLSRVGLAASFTS